MKSIKLNKDIVQSPRDTHPAPLTSGIIYHLTILDRIGFILNFVACTENIINNYTLNTRELYNIIIIT